MLGAALVGVFAGVLTGVLAGVVTAVEEEGPGAEDCGAPDGPEESLDG